MISRDKNAYAHSRPGQSPSRRAGHGGRAQAPAAREAPPGPSGLTERCQRHPKHEWTQVRPDTAGVGSCPTSEWTAHPGRSTVTTTEDTAHQVPTNPTEAYRWWETLEVTRKHESWK